MKNKTEKSNPETKFAWVSKEPLFRNLTATEVAEFRQWAHENYDSRNGIALSIMHPIIQEEFRLITKERNSLVQLS